jgi:hypothetical protein
MNIDTELLDHLKQRHAFEMWKDRNALDKNLHIWKFFFGGHEFPGWQMLRAQSIEADMSSSCIKSIWQRFQPGKDELLCVDVYECKSRVDAHEFLIRLLGEFMSPLIQRRENAENGDVEFAGPESTYTLFARANLVVSLSNAGADLVPVAEIAHKFDAMLSTLPQIANLKIVFEVLPNDFILITDRVLIALATASLDTPPSECWYKLFSDSGEISREANQLIYRPISNTTHEVMIVTVHPGKLGN